MHQAVAPGALVPCRGGGRGEAGEGWEPALARCSSLDPWTAMTEVPECFTMNSTAVSPSVSYRGTHVYDMRLQACMGHEGVRKGEL